MGLITRRDFRFSRALGALVREKSGTLNVVRRRAKNHIGTRASQRHANIDVPRHPRLGVIARYDRTRQHEIDPFRSEFFRHVPEDIDFILHASCQPTGPP